MVTSDDDAETEQFTSARSFDAEATSELRSVQVIEGPDRGRTFVLDASAPSRLLLGTGPACGIRLTDPHVSRRHAAFEPTSGGRYRLTDLDSTNGTIVNGTAVVVAYVRGGEIVKCGETVMRLEADVAESAPALPNAVRFGRTIGASVAMRRLYPLCHRLAAATIPVVIEGETGTGKEVLAESIHEAGKRRGPFIVFDCTTVAPSLVEAELFGHHKGAFTGATADRRGVFEEAHEGTLFIDEIGDLDLALQAKLLRVIDRKELRRVGGQRVVTVDVRVLAATRRDLDKEVAMGRFRDDLFHRLAIGRIELPPLRDRHGDVALLARHFATELRGAATVAQEVTSKMASYTWPGNVRELRNVVARYVELGELVQPPDAPPPAGAQGDWIDPLVAPSLPFPIARRRVIEEFERRYVQNLLAAHGGNVTQAAKASGLGLRYFRAVKARMQRE